jgi:hypothetical protein
MSCIAALKPIVAVNTPSKIKSKPKTTSSRVPPLKKIERSNDFLSVAERVNGRAAMIGFTAALAFLGTAANPKDEGYVQGFWKPETELVNGRLAMIGIVSLLLTESLHPHVPLF